MMDKKSQLLLCDYYPGIQRPPHLLKRVVRFFFRKKVKRTDSELRITVGNSTYLGKIVETNENGSVWVELGGKVE